MNGELNVFDTRNGQSRHLAIDVPGDGLDTRPSQIAADDQIEDAALSPKGERAVFVARGDVFNAPIEKGVTRNLTRSSGAHDKWARWSPDGRRIAFLSDRSGEEEVYLVDASGAGKPEQLTTGGKALRFAPEWAPDGKRLAFSDKDGRLWVVTLADKKLAEVARDVRGEIRDYAWSPCGGHLAFSMANPSGFRSVWIWSVEDGKLRRITDEQFHAANPAWDPKGDYLYYLSARSYLPQFDSFDLNFADRPQHRRLRARPAQGRGQPLPPRRGQGDDRRGEAGGGQEAGQGQGEGKGQEEGARLHPDRLRRPRLAGGPRARAVRQLRLPERRRRASCSTSGSPQTASASPPSGRRCRSSPSKTARPLRSPRGSAATPCPRTAPRCWSSRAASSTSTTPPPAAKTRRRRSTPAAWSWTACPPRSGRRSSARPGAGTATTSTPRT